MSPSRKSSEPDEPDRVDGQNHPRATYDFIGQPAALAQAANSLRSGKPPQAWLIGGPPGTGKATLAYRIARYLLRHGATSEGPADVMVPANDVVARQIEAESHPNLLVLKRRADDRGRLKTVLGVDEIRRLTGFFGMTAGAGGWRVAIIDSADEMNDNAANALLKILEEPPPRGLLLLISHAPGRLLPTIRSRCRRLDLKPLSDTVLQEALVQRLPRLDGKNRDALVRVAEGSLGLALRLAGDEGLELAREADALIAARGATDVPKLLALGDRVARATDGLAHFGRFLAQALSRRIRERTVTEKADERGVTMWEEVIALFERAAEVHMEPRQTRALVGIARRGR